MVALIVAANELLLTGGASAQSLTEDDCIFYSGHKYEIINNYYIRNNHWSRPGNHDINSARVRKGCVAAFLLYRYDDGSILQKGGTTVDDPFFYIPTLSRLSYQGVRTACVCQDHCIETTIEYGQEKNTNQRSSSACLNRGDIISIPNLGETTFDNNLGFVTIKAERQDDYNNDLKPPRYEIRAYQHPGGTGSILHSHKMQGQNVMSGNGRTWWTSENVKFSASSLYVERTF